MIMFLGNKEELGERCLRSGLVVTYSTQIGFCFIVPSKYWR